MKRYLHLTLFLMTLLVGGCDKPIDLSGYDSHPLTLKVVELQGNRYKITWNALPTSDFIDYQIIRAINDTVRDMQPNDTLFRTAGLVTRIGDKYQNTFTDSVTIAGQKVSFRLFARYRDHLVSSINVTLSGGGDIIEISNIGDHVFHSAKINSFLLLDKTGNLITTLKTNAAQGQEQEKKVEMDDVTTMSLDDESAAPSLYISNSLGSGLMQRLNPITLETQLSMFLGTRNAPASVAGGALRAFCTVVEDPKKSSIQLFMTDLALGSQIANVSFTDGIAWQLFKVPTTDAFFAIEPNTETARVMIFQNYNTQNLASRIDANTNGANLIDNQRFIFAPNGSFFVTGKQGNLYNRQVVFSKRLNNNGNYNHFYIDANLNIYAATNRRVDIYNAPNYNLTRSVACRSNPTKIFGITNQLYLFSPSVNQANSTMLERIVL
ncbi:MAG: hypothetical protein RL329_3364 [Bacteroidota bacterium]